MAWENEDIENEIDRLHANATPEPSRTTGGLHREIFKNVITFVKTQIENNFVLLTTYNAFVSSVNSVINSLSLLAHEHDNLLLLETITQEDVDNLKKYKGTFLNETELTTEYPTGVIGDWAYVESTQSFWVWSSAADAWINTKDTSVNAIENKLLWNVASNTPTLSDTTGTINDLYIVSVGGTRNLGSGVITFEENDIVLFDGTKYIKNSATAGTSTPNALIKQGDWNANTNTPTLTNGTGTVGHFYVVSVAGSANFGAGSIPFSVGDWVWYNAGVWAKIVVSGEAPEIFTVKQISEVKQTITVADASLVTIDFSLGTFVNLNITSAVPINIGFTGTTGKQGTAYIHITGNAQQINLPSGTTQYDADGYETTNLIVPRTKTTKQRLVVVYDGTTYFVGRSNTI